MWRLALAFVTLFGLSPVVHSVEKENRVVDGEPPARFDENIKALTAGMAKAKTLTLLEGLPHQMFEKAALDKELKDKKTVKQRDFPFYEGAITPKADDAKALIALFGDLKSFARYRGEKKCGGFHPDWLVEFKDGDDTYQALVCFGCHEARLYGPKNDVYADLNGGMLEKLHAILGAQHKNRLKEK
ncbi:hypothetical protein [Zavarzinella formosa]|uniref:hypothetical protein n=1 Tax=Zavarzinella formosa TaxID=360055 RepID=UPI0002F1D0E1|nr:hypothetical protein [Zavarzinella formosa]